MEKVSNLNQNWLLKNDRLSVSRQLLNLSLPASKELNIDLSLLEMLFIQGSNFGLPSGLESVVTRLICC